MKQASVVLEVLLHLTQCKLQLVIVFVPVIHADIYLILHSDGHVVMKILITAVLAEISIFIELFALLVHAYIDGSSKQQILLPVQVLASGESGLLVQLTNAQNKPVGYPVNINLKLSVISPVATWITSGAAVLLFIAALVQSLRRVRRGK